MKKKHKAKAKKSARAASKRAVSRAKKRRPTTTNPAPRGALRVPAVNPPEKERKMARKKSKKKSSKKNPAKKRSSKRNPSSHRGHHAARHASKRMRRRAHRNPGTFGEVAAAMGGGVLGGALEIGQEYIPSSPTIQAVVGSAATGAAAVGLHFVSRSARDGAIGHLAGKVMRDVRVMLLTKSTAPADTGKHGLMSFGGDVESGTGRIASGATARALGARRSASGVTADRFATGVAPGSR